MFKKQITIGRNKIGDNCPTYFIAELSANHNQDYNIAVKTIKAMKEAQTQSNFKLTRQIL